MGLRKCRACGHDISKRAKECPNCGEPQHKGSGKTVLLVILIGVGIALSLPKDQGVAPDAGSSEPAQASTEPAEPEVDMEQCRQTLSCWADEHWSWASVVCEEAVERSARYDFEWTDEWHQVKFGRYAWRNQDAGTVTYMGDTIKLQNGFGAWQHHMYLCHYDPAFESVLAVELAPGRFSQ